MERLPEVGGYSFSVQAAESGLAGVPLLLLKEMYSQASQLLESEEAVLRAPSNNQNAYVIRNDGRITSIKRRAEKLSAKNAPDSSLQKYVVMH